VNELSIAFPNGSRIVGLPGNEATVRGFSAVSLTLIDEAARVQDAFYRAVRPMLAVGDGDLWLKQGFFWEEWGRGGEGWQRISVRAPDCPRISARFLEEERANALEATFRQEYLCEFLDREGAVFTREMIEGMLD
jgi:phage FluMu gp28-like protein